MTFSRRRSLQGIEADTAHDQSTEETSFKTSAALLEE